MTYTDKVWAIASADHGPARLEAVSTLFSLASLTDADGGYHNVLLTDEHSKLFAAIRVLCNRNIGDFTFPLDRYGYVSILDGRTVASAISKQATLIDPITQEARALTYATALKKRMWFMASKRIKPTEVVSDKILMHREPTYASYEGLAHLRALFMVEGSAYSYKHWLRSWIEFVSNYDMSHTVRGEDGNLCATMSKILVTYLGGSAAEFKTKVTADFDIVKGAFTRVINGDVDYTSDAAFSTTETTAIDNLIDLRFVFVLFRTCCARTDAMYSRVLPVTTAEQATAATSEFKYFAGRKEFAELQTKYPLMVGLAAFDGSSPRVSTIKEAMVRPTHAANTFVDQAQRRLPMYRKLTRVDEGGLSVYLRGTTDASTTLGMIDDTPTLPKLSIGDWNFLRMTITALVIPKKTPLHVYTDDLCYSQLVNAILTGTNVFRSVYTSGAHNSASLAKIRELWQTDPDVLVSCVVGDYNKLADAEGRSGASVKDALFHVVNPLYTSSNVNHTLVNMIYGLRCYGVDKYTKVTSDGKSNDVRGNVIEWAADHASFVNAILKTDGSADLPTDAQFEEAQCFKHAGLREILNRKEVYFSSQYANNYVPLMVTKWLCEIDNDLTEDELHFVLSVPFSAGDVFVIRVKRVDVKKVLVSVFTFAPYNKEVF